MDRTGKRTKKGAKGRVIAWFLCFAVLCSLLSGYSIATPAQAMESDSMVEITVELEAKEPESSALEEQSASDLTSTPLPVVETPAADTEQPTESDSSEIQPVDTVTPEEAGDADTDASATPSPDTPVEGNGTETAGADVSDPAAAQTASDSETDTPNAVPSETTAVAEAEEARPEFSFSEELDGVTVHIHAAEGVLPEGVTAQVGKLSDSVLETAVQSIRSFSSDKEILELIGFDIRFSDAEGTELHQFEKEIEITCSGLKFAEGADKMQVFHADESGNVTNALTGVMELAESVTFSSSEFSPILVAAYAETTDTEAPNNGISMASNEGIAPAAIGGQDTLSLTVGQTATVSSTAEDRAVGETTSIFGTMYYHESWSSSNEAVATVAGNPDGTTGDDQYKQTSATVTAVAVGTATITHTYYTASTGWLGLTSYTEQTETITVTVAEPVIVYYTVSFNVGEAANAVTAPGDITVTDGECVSTLPVLEWRGEDGEPVKIFAGWYSDESLTTEFTESTPVTADMTLYANWVDAEAEGIYYVNFYSQDAQTVHLTLAVSEGKTVRPAQGPTLTDKVFIGWSVTRQEENPASALTAFDFSAPVSEAVEDGETTLNLYAWYAKSVKVTFVANGGIAVPTQIIAEGGTATGVTPARTGYTFVGWYTDKELANEFDFTTPVNNDITLYAKWTANMVPVTLVYMYENADDADYSPAGYSETVYAPAGSYLSIEKSSVTRIGQTHNVRYSDTAGGTLTGYASTAAAGGANATIDDVRDTYYQYETATNNRQVMPDGSTVVLVYYNRARITLTFTYDLESNASMDVENLISAADRTKYNVVYTPTTSGGYNRFAYSFTAKYGENIVPVWARTGWVTNDSSGRNTFYTWNCPDGHYQTSNMYTLESSLFKTDSNSGLAISNGKLVGTGALDSGSTSVKKDWLIYARTTLPGETVDFTYGGKNYTIYSDACQLGYSGTGTFIYKALDGCTPYSGEPELKTTYSSSMKINNLTVNGTLKSKFDTAFPNEIASDDNCQVLLYDRNKLTLSLWANDDAHPVGSAAQTAEYLYGDWIYNDDADLLKTVEAAMAKEGYRFAGWFTDPNFTQGTEYTTNEDSRIYGNLNLYAKWEPNQFLAEYYLYMDDNTPYATQGFAEGGKIDDKFVPAAVQSSFLGWYWYDASGTLVPFDFTSAVGAGHVDEDGKLKLYARWSGTTGKVSFLPGIGGDNATQEVVDSRDFAINEAAVQMPAYTTVWTDGSVPATSGLTFVGWKAPNGKIYQPGRYVLVTREWMQFEAQWSSDAVKLIYNANGGTGSNVTETWARNSVVDIWDNMDATTPHFTRVNYELIGWDTNPNATTPAYSLGKGTITLTADTTTLYAIWKPCTITLTIEKQVTGNFGDVNKQFAFSYSYTADGNTVTGTFSLSDNQTTVIENVPVGASLTLTETNADGYTVSGVYGVNGTIQNTVNGAMTFTVNAADSKITVTNNLDVVPDTGVLLDTLPYILILAAVAVGAILFLRGRKNRRDDERR